MGVSAILLLLFGLPLSDAVAPQAAAESFALQIEDEADGICVQPAVQTTGARARSPVTVRDKQRGKRAPRAAAKAVERPEEFWWDSTEDVLRGIYGECGPRPCCKFCRKPCGATCISRFYTCRVGCGCACNRPLGYGDEDFYLDPDTGGAVDGGDGR